MASGDSSDDGGAPPQGAGTSSAGIARRWDMFSFPFELRNKSVAERRAHLERTAVPCSADDEGMNGVTRLSWLGQLEIGLNYLVWTAAACLPLLAAVSWLLLPYWAALTLTVLVVLGMFYPHGDWKDAPKSRFPVFMYNLPVLRNFIKYYSLRLVTEDNALFEDKNYIIAGVPHGLWPAGFVLLDWGQKLLPITRRIRAAAAGVVLRLPIWRQVSLWAGTIEASRRSIEGTLKKGESVMFKARQHPDKEVFLLSTRRGLPRIALRTGTPIVPCIMFGNTDIIRAVQDSCGIMERLSRALRMSLVLLRGRFFLPVPFRKPVSVVLGKPLVPPPEDCEKGSKEPSKEAIARLHKRMVDATVALYQKHRAAFANTDKDPLVV